MFLNILYANYHMYTQVHDVSVMLLLTVVVTCIRDTCHYRICQRMSLRDMTILYRNGMCLHPLAG